MVWFKVDDTLAFHAKVVAAGNPAMGLWVRAGAWAAQQLTDGFVPKHMVGSLGTTRQAAALVTAGLWLTVDGGFRFHDWTDGERQPTREQVESKREAWREKKRQQRRDPAGKYQVSPGDKSESPQGSPTVPSRPVPSRPTKEEEIGAKAPRRATLLPASWHPTDEHLKRAKDAGLNPGSELEKFRAHAEEKGRTAKSWNAAFTRWLINAAEYAKRDTATQTKQPTLSDNQWMFR